MRRYLLLFIFAATAVVYGDNSFIGFEQITVANTSIGFTAAKITPSTGSGMQAQHAICRLETAEIRYQLDGTAPTTTVGTLLEPLETITFSGHDVLAAFRAIRTTSTSGTLSCTYTAP